jgi:hypothetical protein
MIEQYGILIGIALLLSVAICGFLLARKAAVGIEQFREHEHQRFAAKKHQ